MPGESKRRFLTLDQVAEELNVGVPLVRTLVKSGELRAIQVCGRELWRVGQADLDEYISHAYATTADWIAADEIADEDSVL